MARGYTLLLRNEPEPASLHRVRGLGMLRRPMGDYVWKLAPEALVRPLLQEMGRSFSLGELLTEAQSLSLPQGRKPLILRAAGKAQLLRELVFSLLPYYCEAAGEFVFPESAPLAILVTSGTTGQAQEHPKTAQQLFGEAQVLIEEFQLRPGERVLSTVSAQHYYGFLFSILAPLVAGAVILALPEAEASSFHPGKVALAVEAHQASLLVSLPVHLAALAELPLPPSSLTRVISSGAPLLAPLAQRFEAVTSLALYDVLGSTETGGIAHARTAQGGGFQAFRGLRVRASAEGYMLLDSPFLAQGQGPLQTADRIELRADGRFLHLGREDGVVKLGGRRVHLRELESRALQVPGVSDAQVLVRKLHGLRGQEVWMAVASEAVTWSDPVPESQARLASDAAASKESALAQLQGELRRRLPEVRRWRWVPRLPRNERGKLPERDLAKLFEVCSQTAHGWELRFLLTADAVGLRGHFPGQPIWPAASQLSEAVFPLAARAGLPAVVGVSQLRLLAPAEPGRLLCCRLEMNGKFELGEVEQGSTKLLSRGRLRLAPANA